jgi:hypothetical protein
MANIPGLDIDVFFGEPEKELPDWRESVDESEEDSDELTEEEREALIGILGFDPRENDDVEKGAGSPVEAPQAKPSPF